MTRYKPDTNLVNHRRRTLSQGVMIGFGALLIARSAPVIAGARQIYTKGRKNLALDGHDAVSYFTESRPRKGRKAFSTQYKGARWLFRSQEHLDAFLSSPDAYAPRYGGYCAYSISINKLVKGDPKLWAIVDARLYINYNRTIHNRWLQRPAVLIERADLNWPSVLG